MNMTGIRICLHKVVLILLAILVFSLMATTAFAKGSNGGSYDTSHSVGQTMPLSENKNTDAYDCLLNAARNLQAFVDLTAFHVTPEECSQMYSKLYREPDLFYVSCNGTFWVKNGYISKCSFGYKCNSQELASAKQSYWKTVSSIVSGVNSSWSDAEKALYLHDYLATHYRYDVTLHNSSAYDLFMDGCGICNAYTMAYSGLLDAVGIPNEFCEIESTEEVPGHIWNVVYIDGNWYHVDVTWDDPIASDNSSHEYYNFGGVNHTYFLKSDSYFMQHGHGNWICSQVCNSRKYDEWVGNDSEAPFVYLNNKWYYIGKDRELYSMSRHLADSCGVLKPKNTWRWNGTYSGLFAYGGYLFYNESDSVCRYDPKTGRQCTVATIGTKTHSLYGMRLDENQIVCCLAEDPTANGARTAQEYRIELPSQWAYNEVSAAIDENLVPVSFQRDYKTPISREAMAEIVVGLIEKATGETANNILKTNRLSIDKMAFCDTKNDSVLICNALGIINGVGNQKFDPNGNLTRGQSAAILNRTAAVLGVHVSGYKHSFTDVKNHWCRSELGWPYSVGIINGVGDNRFNPDGALTREQAIILVYRAFCVLNE